MRASELESSGGQDTGKGHVQAGEGAVWAHPSQPEILSGEGCGVKSEPSGNASSWEVTPLLSPSLDIKYTPWRHPCVDGWLPRWLPAFCYSFHSMGLALVAWPGPPPLLGSRFHSSWSESLAGAVGFLLGSCLPICLSRHLQLPADKGEVTWSAGAVGSHRAVPLPGPCMRRGRGEET